MDFTFNDEQQMIHKMCREFAEEEIKPRAEEMDRAGEFPYEIVRKMAELGLLGLPFPEEYGGAGADYLTYCLALEEIGRGDASVGITMEAHTSLGATPFYLFGSEEQKQTYLPPLARGEQLWSFGLTEPGAGSDSGGTETHAEKAKGMWTINGAKNFITNAGTEMSWRRDDHSGDGDARRMGARRSATSSCQRGRRAILSARRITRWAGAPPIRAR